MLIITCLIKLIPGATNRGGEGSCHQLVFLKLEWAKREDASVWWYHLPPQFAWVGKALLMGVQGINSHSLRTCPVCTGFNLLAAATTALNAGKIHGTLDLAPALKRNAELKPAGRGTLHCAPSLLSTGRYLVQGYRPSAKPCSNPNLVKHTSFSPLVPFHQQLPC